MKLLLDEMYPPALAEALRANGIEARTVTEAGLAGRSDPNVLASAAADGYVLLTENVADFVRCELIREAIAERVERDRPRPRGGLYSSGDSTLSEHVDEELNGFGAR